MNTLNLTIGNKSTTVKRFVSKSGEVTLSAVVGGKKVGGQRIPAAALSKLAGTTVKCGTESVTLEFQPERPENTRGKKGAIWAPRTIGTVEAELVNEDGETERFGITVEAKTEVTDGKLANTAMLTIRGKLRSENRGGGGRTAAPVVDLDDALDFLSN